MRTCEARDCETPIQVSERQGRPRRFCTPACRVRAHRAKRPPLPTELTSRPRWVRHDESKRPLTVDGRLASVTDPSTWCTYAEARRSTAGAGMGFVLGDGLGCIDLDDAIVDGQLAPWAQGIVAQYRGQAIYIETSRSGNGLHLFMSMEEAPGRRIREGDVKMEIYSRARYIALGTPYVE